MIDNIVPYVAKIYPDNKDSINNFIGISILRQHTIEFYKENKEKIFNVLGLLIEEFCPTDRIIRRFARNLQASEDEEAEINAIVGNNAMWKFLKSFSIYANFFELEGLFEHFKDKDSNHYNDMIVDGKLESYKITVTEIDSLKKLKSLITKVKTAITEFSGLLTYFDNEDERNLFERLVLILQSKYVQDDLISVSEDILDDANAGKRRITEIMKSSVLAMTYDTDFDKMQFRVAQNDKGTVLKAKILRKMEIKMKLIEDFSQTIGGPQDQGPSGKKGAINQGVQRTLEEIDGEFIQMKNRFLQMMKFISQIEKMYLILCQNLNDGEDLTQILLLKDASLAQFLNPNAMTNKIELTIDENILENLKLLIQTIVEVKKEQKANLIQKFELESEQELLK